MKLGTDIDSIIIAENKLSIKLPEGYIKLLIISNGIECPPDWEFFSIFDKSNPAKSSRNELVSENTSGRWDYMPINLLSIATNGTGNYLVIKKDENNSKIYTWNHETTIIKEWNKTFEDILEIAKKRIIQIEKNIDKMKK